MSTKTGLIDSYKRQLEEEMNEKGVVMTSSPFFKPRAITAKCKAQVPLATAQANFVPTYLEMFFSKPRYFDPRDKTPDERVFNTAA